MTAEQLTLDLFSPSPVAVAQCGYCDCRLTRQPAGDWACSHCVPHLAQIGTEGAWIAFHRRARTATYRKGCQR